MTAPCTRCQSPLTPDDLRCAICGLPPPADDPQASGQTHARIFRCQGCGAAIAYDAELKALRCNFCESVLELETPSDPIEQAEHFLTFGVDEATARTAFRQWLRSRGWFQPADLASGAAIDGLRPLWWVGWAFEADITVSWAADSNADSRRSNWAPHAGETALSLRDVIVPASRGLSADECWALAAAYRLTDGSPTPQGPKGATIEQFDAQRSSARKVIAHALTDIARQRILTEIPGSTHRHVRVAVMPQRLQTKRCAMPAWVFAYRYRSKLYRAIVHGQEASLMIGHAPVSVAKIVIVVILALIALATVVVITHA